MTTEADKTISDWNKGRPGTTILTLKTTKSSQSRLLEEFCERLSAFAPGIMIEIAKDSNSEEPFIKTESNIIFKAVPEEKLLETFLNLLTPDAVSVPDTIADRLENFETPISLSIYITPFCPFCPKAITDVSALTVANNNIEVVIIDGSLFPELAQKNNVVSAPTIILNDDFRWTGQTINVANIAEVIGNSKPEELSVEALRAIVESGKAKTLADLMLRAQNIFPAFFELITHEKWPVRLGAMVTLEEIAAVDKSLSEAALSALWNRFDSYTSSVQGDIIYITGETGGSHNIKRMEIIINGDYSSELKESAEEAVETIKLTPTA